MTKHLRDVLRTAERHWVGDGFPVRTLFAYPDLGATISPFLLLDHAGPAQFPPSVQRRGVGEHPHRGFETVTIVYAGEVEHRDSSGGGGQIGPGDVQWMTAASGLVHEEFHGRHFAQAGGDFEMAQLWVNLPQKDKKAAPGYQAITSDRIPTVTLPAGSARVIAGRLGDAAGPARTFTPIDVWDLRLDGDAPIDLPVAEGHTTLLVVLRGSLTTDDGTTIGEAEVGIYDRAGTDIRLASAANATALLLAGAPIHEPIVGQGPFVMNTVGEIKQAMLDYQSGRMGHLT